MKSKTSLEKQPPSINMLRKGFIASCTMLGLRKDTIVALTCMLHSEELMKAILYFMVEIEETGRLEDMDMEERTTMLVKVASELREAWDRLQSKNSTL